MAEVMIERGPDSPNSEEDPSESSSNFNAEDEMLDGSVGQDKEEEEMEDQDENGDVEESKDGEEEESAELSSPQAKNKSISSTPTHFRTKSNGLGPPMMEDSRLPEGWYRQVTQRTMGASAGKYDVYIYSPYKKKKFRSRQEIARYAEQQGLDLDLEDFDFSVHGNQNQSPKKAKSKKSTPKKVKASSSGSAKGAGAKAKKKKSSSKGDALKKKKKELLTVSQRLVVKMAFPGLGKRKKQDYEEEIEEAMRAKKKKAAAKAKGETEEEEQFEKDVNDNASASQSDHSDDSDNEQDDNKGVGENSRESLLSDNEIENTEPMSPSISSARERNSSISSVRKNSVSSGSPLARLNKSDYESDASDSATSSPRAKYTKTGSDCKGSTATLRRSYSSISTGKNMRSPNRPVYRRGSGQLLAGL